jgi:hypothetical protein
LGAALFVVVGLLVGQKVLSPDPSWGERALFVLWLIGTLYAFYQNLYQIAYDLRCSDNLLTWKSPLRTGTVPLSELRRIYSRWGSLLVVAAADGHRIQIYARKGL